MSSTVSRASYTIKCVYENLRDPSLCQLSSGGKLTNRLALLPHVCGQRDARLILHRARQVSAVRPVGVPHCRQAASVKASSIVMNTPTDVLLDRRCCCDTVSAPLEAVTQCKVVVVAADDRAPSVLDRTNSTLRSAGGSNIDLRLQSRGMLMM
jgi:hypothetical protein